MYYIRKKQKRPDPIVNMDATKALMECVNTDGSESNRGRRYRPNDATEVPDTQSSITLSGYQNAISFNDTESDVAHLKRLQPNSHLKLKRVGNKYFFTGADGVDHELCETTVQQLECNGNFRAINLPLLRTCYSMIQQNPALVDYEKHTIKPVKIYIPDLLKKMGKDEHPDQKQINEMYNEFCAFRDLIAVVKLPGYKGVSLVPIIYIGEYNMSENTVEFASPYFDYLCRTLHSASIKRLPNGKPKIEKGKAVYNPTHSYLIKESIMSCKSIMAIETVDIIVKTIEMAGGKGAHISAKTIVDRNIYLKEQLENTIPKHQGRVLQRCFSKTFELLRTETRLTEMYKNISLPDPNNVNMIPKPSTLDKTIYNFTHEGKIKPKAK